MAIKMTITPEHPVTVEMTFYEAWVTLVVLQAFEEFGVKKDIPDWKIAEWKERTPTIQGKLIDAMGGEAEMYRVLEEATERAKKLPRQ